VPIIITSKPERIAEYLKGVELKLSIEEVEEITRVGLSYYFKAS
jgi:diketogulonate reductase-like aldo/keto reductase